jgi:uncharacterized protein involved in outer membrane biogenesis
LKTLLLTLALLLVVVVATVLVVPSFIDWNPYRQQIATRIEAMTGRAVAIDGALSMQVLPSPTLSVEGVRLANIDGGATRDMARIGALKVAVDLAPLLQGELRVRSVRVIDPVVLLERLEDGRANWVFDTGATGHSGSGVTLPVPGHAPPDTSEPADNGVGLTVRLDSVRVETGLIVFRDATRGWDFRVEAPALTLSATSLRGPFRVQGDARLWTRPVALDIALGELRDGRRASLEANLLLPDTGDTIAITGTVRDVRRDPTFQGRVEATAASLARSMEALAAPPALARLAMPASVRADVSATLQEATVSGLDLSLGLAEARGDARLAFPSGAAPAVDADLRLRPLDLDAWIADLAATADTSEAWTFAVPQELSAALDLSADGLTWHGEPVRRVHLAARLEDGRVHLDTARAALPGASEISVTGEVEARDGQPHATGMIEARSGNLREVLTWLRVPVGAIPPDRLRAFTLTAALDGSPGTLSARDIDMTLDTTRATGAVVLRPGPRPGIGLNVSLDSLNLDAYRPRGTDTPLPFSLLGGALGGLDANVRFAVGQLTVDNLPVRDVLLQGALVRGRLSLDRAQVGDVAGIQVTATGALADLDGLPRAEQVTVTAETSNPARSARLLRIDPPAALRRLGAVTQALTLDGTLEALDITTATRAQGGSLDTNGRLTGLLGPDPRFDIAVDLHHPDADRLIRLVLPDRRPVPAPPGAVSLTAQARGDPTAVEVNDLDLRVGDSTLTGQGRLTLGGERPHLTAALSTPGLTVAALPPPTALDGLDADITLRSETFDLGGHTLQDVDMTAHLADGVLRIDPLTGGLHGGHVEGAVTVVAGSPPTYDLSLSARDVSVARLLGQDAEGSADGTAALEIEIGGAGETAPALLADLTGKGRLNLTGLDSAAAVGLDSPLAALLEPIEALNDLASSVLGDLTREQRLTDLDSAFVLNAGTLGVDPLRVTSPLYEASFAGTVDLTDHTVQASGTAAILDERLRDGLNRVIRLPERIPVSVSGPLGAPDVTVRTAPRPANPRPANPRPANPRPAVPQPSPDPRPPARETPDSIVEDLLRDLTQ